MEKIQSLEQYSVLASRTCPDLGSDNANLLHMNLGVKTEIGEVLDILKKNLAYKKPIDFVNFGEELADIVWYLINKHRMFSKQVIADETELLLLVNETFLIVDETLLSLGLTEASTAKSAIILLDTLYISAMSLEIINVGEDYEDMSNIASLFYLAELYEIDLWQHLTNNIEKLKIRYPEKFNEHDALNRDLDKEREQLEK